MNGPTLYLLPFSHALRSPLLPSFHPTPALNSSPNTPPDYLLQGSFPIPHPAATHTASRTITRIVVTRQPRVESYIIQSQQSVPSRNQLRSTPNPTARLPTRPAKLSKSNQLWTGTLTPTSYLHSPPPPEALAKTLPQHPPQHALHRHNRPTRCALGPLFSQPTVPGVGMWG